MPFFDPIRIGASSATADSVFTVDRSLRFNDGDNTYLNRTPSSASNRRTWTWSGWIKRCTFGAVHDLFSAYDGSAYNIIRIGSNDQLNFQSNTAAIKLTNAKLRDPSAWYHIVVSVDTTNSTAADRVIIYINGARQTLATDNSVSQNTDYAFNTTNAHTLGVYANGSSYDFDGYMAEINFIDGQALTPSSFAETNAETGQWNPKKYTGSYGTNGFYLNFSDNSGTTATTLGKDSSGNGNNFTPNNFSTSAGEGNDSVLDTPTTNYCTLNPLDKAAAITFKNGNLQVDNTSTGNYNGFRGTFGSKTGKYYWEIKFPSTGYLDAIGIARADGRIDNGNQPTYRIVLGLGSWYNSYNSGGVATYVNATPSGDYPSVATWSGASNYSSNDVYMIAVDFGAGKIWWGKNNSWFNNSGTANPATGTDPRITFTTGNEWFPYSQSGDSSTSPQAYNFGQQGFAYTPPSGFVALNSANLPDPTIFFPNQHFDTLLYEGNGSDGHAITGLNFVPDWVWIKNRESGVTHYIVDSMRKSGSNYRYLSTDGTNPENDASARFTSIDSGSGTNNGFTLPSGGTFTNANNIDYVAWNWYAGGSTVTNNDGDISSQVRANTTAGFSIVTYTGTGSNATIGHGLGVAPKAAIFKRRDSSGNWMVYHQALGNTHNLYLHTTDTSQDDNHAFNDTSPTSSVFSLGISGFLNASGGTFVGYIFSEVSGYSKFGSYTGNGSTDGTFVFTGFRPAWIMLKRYDSANNWHIADNKRQNPFNVVTAQIYPNLSSAEVAQSDLDIVANGFKIRNSANFENASGGTYIYLAFAESPFKNARAR